MLFRMSFITSVSPVRAFVLGLALVAAHSVQAQQAAVKVKTKTADAAGNTVSKSKVTTPAPVANAPKPVSPLVSSPQVILPAQADDKSAWLTDLSAAQAQAKATNRPILAVFSGSDWCKPCIIYEQEVFAKPEFAAYAKDRLVLAHFDFPRQKRNQPAAAQVKLNEAAAAQLNREGDFPLAVVISPDGKVLAKTGYIAGGPTAFEAYLKKVVPTL
jgi:thiol-disulfide isomerase/thioredoxin